MLELLTLQSWTQRNFRAAARTPEFRTSRFGGLPQLVLLNFCVRAYRLKIFYVIKLIRALRSKKLLKLHFEPEVFGILGQKGIIIALLAPHNGHFSVFRCRCNNFWRQPDNRNFNIFAGAGRLTKNVINCISGPETSVFRPTRNFGGLGMPSPANLF